MPYHLRSFENEIESSILTRGYDYYLEGRVKNIFNINGYEWQAIVAGYDDYVVQLKIQNNSVVQWGCTCSDAEGDICKHVIAVLYFIRTEGDKLVHNDPTGFEEIKEALSYLPPHVLRYLILKFTASNNNFRKYLDEYFKSK